jgi:uncharacterized protein YegL
MEEQIIMPDVKLTTRPLHFFWVVDTSGSMTENGKMGIVNHAIQECVPEMRNVAKENVNAQLFVRALRFSSGASWVTADPVKIDEFAWVDLKAGGVTDLGAAFKMLAAQFTMPPMPQRALPPVVVLLSDGQPTDNYKKSLDELLKLPWWKKTVKIAIAIGKEAQSEDAQKVFSEFTGNKELILEANSATHLAELIKWASTQVVKDAAAPPSEGNKAKQTADGAQITPEPVQNVIINTDSIPKPDDIGDDGVF